MPTPTAVEQKKGDKVSTLLSKVLANTYLLYVKTQNFHWNVVDPRFYSLHLFFESQYKELADATDELAERIRMLGQRAPGSMREFLELADLKEADDDVEGNEMISDLMEDRNHMIESLKKGISACQDAGDEGSADLLIKLLRDHEKAAWMLRSHL